LADNFLMAYYDKTENKHIRSHGRVPSKPLPRVDGLYVFLAVDRLFAINRGMERCIENKGVK